MTAARLQTAKFADRHITAKGEKRAWVNMTRLRTLWFNTGTLCNLTCTNCYIESSPKNDRLLYLTFVEVVTYLDEILEEGYPTTEIGITGGESFMNPDIIQIMEECLKRGFSLLVLTNAMQPMMKHVNELLRLNDTYWSQLTLRVSVDHFQRELHESERGERSWTAMMKGLRWLSDNGFNINIAGRTRWGENEKILRQGYAQFLRENSIKVAAHDKKQLTLLPEMDEGAPVPEITTACWEILGVNPDEMMCASSRMIVKHKGSKAPSVMACTLLAYDPQFNMGRTLKQASQSVYLNHPHCAKFCVLGGGTCG